MFQHFNSFDAKISLVVVDLCNEQVLLISRLYCVFMANDSLSDFIFFAGHMM